MLERTCASAKLPRGALAGNRFRIRAAGVRGRRGSAGAAASTPSRAAACRTTSARSASAVTAAISSASLARSVRRRDRERSFVLSAARSAVFNAVLAERVSDGTWCSSKPATWRIWTPRQHLRRRSRRRRAARPHRAARHPSDRPDVGRWRTAHARARPRARERVAASFPEACAVVIAAGMKQERRSLRLAVRDSAGIGRRRSRVSRSGSREAASRRPCCANARSGERRSG